MNEFGQCPKCGHAYLTMERICETCPPPPSAAVGEQERAELFGYPSELQHSDPLVEVLRVAIRAALGNTTGFTPWESEYEAGVTRALPILRSLLTPAPSASAPGEFDAPAYANEMREKVAAYRDAYILALRADDIEDAMITVASVAWGALWRYHDDTVLSLLTRLRAADARHATLTEERDQWREHALDAERELAIAGVRGSPPVGGGMIPNLLQRAQEAESQVRALTTERDCHVCKRRKTEPAGAICSFAHWPDTVKRVAQSVRDHDVALLGDGWYGAGAWLALQPVPTTEHEGEGT